MQGYDFNWLRSLNKLLSKAVEDLCAICSKEKFADFVDVAQDILKKAENISLSSVDDFSKAAAKKYFKKAHTLSLDAFYNATLSAEGRIRAAYLGILAEILRGYEHLETAGLSSQYFLQMLHNMPEVREMFSICLSGGLLSKLNRSKREENVKSVMLINETLHEIFNKLDPTYYSRETWPVIQLSDEPFHPIEDKKVLAPIIDCH